MKFKLLLFSFCLSIVSANDFPVIANFSPSTSQSNGTAFVLVCNVIRGSSDQLSFEWAKNGQKMASHSSRYQIDTKGTLSIFSLNGIEASDSGNYTCTVRNQFGTDQQHSVLSVTGLCK